MEEIKRYLTEWTDEEGNIYLVRDKNTYSKDELNEKIQGLVDGSLEPELDKLATKEYVSDQLSAITNNVSDNINKINKLSESIDTFATKDYVSEQISSVDISTNSVVEELKSSIKSLMDRISTLETENKELRVLIEKNSSKIEYYHNAISFVDNETGEEYDIVLVDNDGIEYDLDANLTTSCNCSK